MTDHNYVFQKRKFNVELSHYFLKFYKLNMFVKDHAPSTVYNVYENNQAYKNTLGAKASHSLGLGHKVKVKLLHVNVKIISY